ncbi:MAG: transglycosylase SLT domain-containing protein, partial [Elusimicrobiota bacterium]
MPNKYMSNVARLPHSPGVYLFSDNSGKVIYTGKAKDLSKRINSYFAKRADDYKISRMFSSIKTVDYIVAESERDALLLESRLIKKLQPKYNTLWRDDKSYPYIKLKTDASAPALCMVHRKKAGLEGKAGKGGVRYYGPYPNSGDVRKLLRWLRVKFMIPPCRENTRRSEPCLYYHLKQCPAPCIDDARKKECKRSIRKAQLFLEGKYLRLKTRLKNEMNSAARLLRFEEAVKLRDTIKTIDMMFEKIRFRRIGENDILPLVEASRGLTELREKLNLPHPPLTIEAFDVSSISGSHPVGAMVRFSRGEPDRSSYRKYNIKGLKPGAIFDTGNLQKKDNVALPPRIIDDYSMIKEIVRRRYSRLVSFSQKLPDLIVIDGGRGHLSVAGEALKEVKAPPVPVISIAKDEEKIYTQSAEEPLRLPADSPALKIIRHIRDEAHRFALAFHRERRSLKKLVGTVIAALLFLYVESSGAPGALQNYIFAGTGDIILKNGNVLSGEIYSKKDTFIIKGKNGWMEIGKQETSKIKITRRDIWNSPPASVHSADTPYDDIINRYAFRYHVPPSLIKALIHAESCFNPRAVSRSGAAGLMQLSRENIKSMKISDPFDPEENIRAGVRYFKLQMDRFPGDIDLAIAAYNAGPNAVRKYGCV